MYSYTIGIDPSGDGITGFCLMCEDMSITYVFEIYRKNYNTDEQYWEACVSHLDRLCRACYGHAEVAVEDFILDRRKTGRFVGSQMPTSKLIGILQYNCVIKNNIKFTLVNPAECAGLYDDDALCALGLLQQTSRGYDASNGSHLSKHMKDAIRVATRHIQGEKDKLK